MSIRFSNSFICVLVTLFFFAGCRSVPPEDPFALEKEEAKQAEASAYFLRATSLILEGDSPQNKKQALGWLRKAFEIDPDDLRIAKTFISMLDDQKDTQEIFNVIQRALKANPDDYELHTMGLFYAVLTGNREKALEHEKWVLQSGHLTQEVLIATYQLYLSMGMERDAIKLSNSSDNPVPHRKELLGNVAIVVLQERLQTLESLSEEKQIEERRSMRGLLEIVLASLKGKQDQQDAYFSCGYLLAGIDFQEGKWTKGWKRLADVFRGEDGKILFSAYSYLMVLFKEYPETESFCLKGKDKELLGFDRNLIQVISCLNHQKYRESLSFMESYRANLAKQHQPLTPDYFDTLFSIYFQMKEVDKGIDVLREGFHQFPQSASLANALAYVLACEGKDLSEANRLVNFALSKVPASYEYLDTKGWVLYKSGRPYEAIQFLLKACEQKEGRNSPDVLSHLRDVLQAVGRFSEAKMVVAE